LLGSTRPFLPQGFGAEMEMRLYVGEDEGDDRQVDEHGPGGLVIETLSNMRTVASLTLEQSRAERYAHLLRSSDSHPFRTNIIKGRYFHALAAA